MKTKTDCLYSFHNALGACADRYHKCGFFSMRCLTETLLYSLVSPWEERLDV